jgi:cytochrome c peroxidase
MELPVEVEIELSPAGSLKQAGLWKELIQLLKNPYDPVVRRPGFGVAMPPLNLYPLDYNFLTGLPLRLRTSDGEVSWDQPGPLFNTGESCLIPDSLLCDAFNTPTVLRTVVGHLVACPNNPVPPFPDAYQAADIPADFCNDKPIGSLVVYNPDANAQIPPNGTVVAVAAFFDGVLHELVFDADGVWTGDYEVLTELETPVNEEDFFRDPTDTAGVDPTLQPLIGRPAAEVLGKALFWDMQVGSDGVQACGSCHFQAGVDNRTRGQLNPGVNAGDLTLQVKPANTDVVPGDFPFHRLANVDAPAESTNCGYPGLPACGDGVILDANDVMSSMGVSRFKLFNDIPPIETFLPPVDGVAALPPDMGTVAPDPVPVNEGFRRVEPRNTPTFHGAAFNFDNFWDGRARFIFNGGSVFGPSDPTAHIFIDNGALAGATNGDIRPDLILAGDPTADQPVRIKFSSLASQSVGPPLSDFEMSFSGRNWAKIGKKLLQANVTPLANQLVATDDSRLGPFSNQGGSNCPAGTTAPDKPGLCISYPELIQAAFRTDLWSSTDHLNGCFTDDANPATPPPPAPVCAAGTPHDPFDRYVLTPDAGPAAQFNTNQFTQMEANFSLLFGLAVQAYEELTIPDDTPADRFFDANPFAGHGVGEPGDQAVLYPTLIPDLVDDGQLNGTNVGTVTLVSGFGPDELFGFDLFAGSNLTAALAPGQTVGASGIDRNPLITNSIGQQIRVGSNPFARSAKCMLCHLGPEQTDHSINISHGLLKNEAEFEYPTPPAVLDPTTNPPTFPPEVDGPFAGLSVLPAPEPSGSSRTVPGLILEEEVGEGVAQDAVEVEPRNFASFDNPATPWDDRIVAQPGNFGFGDQGIYNIGIRPIAEDTGRGGPDPFGWPLSLSALTLKNIGGQDFEPCNGPLDSCVMANFDPFNIGATFELTGGGAFFPGTTYTLQSINPGFERDPIEPQMPAYMAPWIHSLPAGELHPQIDEMAGMVPNTITPPNGGPGIEFPEILFGADLHCASYNPEIFGLGPPNFGWGSPLQTEGPSLCPQHQSGVAGNIDFPSQGTWPVPNRVLRDGAFKAPSLRNVELTGPYFHTGSLLTLRQVVDFYMRGGDFPIANAENRDPHIVEIEKQAFSFGRTTGADLIAPLNHVFSVNPPFTLVGTFADGLPDGAFLYDEYPDSDHPLTPELPFPSREAALEDAKNAIVKFLLALTDPRVKFERAPFDRPEIFVPIDGTAPENTAGRAGLLADARFRHLAAVGAAGNATPLPNFLAVSSVAGPDVVDHFDSFTGNPVLVDSTPPPGGTTAASVGGGGGGGCFISTAAEENTFASLVMLALIAAATGLALGYRRIRRISNNQRQ